MNLLNMSNVVKFKLPGITYDAERPPVTQAAPKPIEREKKKPVVIEALPWEPLPEGYSDYRALLQRDGLFLWFWARYNDKTIKIVWMRSSGNMHKYQCLTGEGDDLSTVFPEKKYSGKYGDPDYCIFAAPRDLTFSARNAFITKLREFGVSTDFDYEFTLGKQRAAREAALLDKIENRPMESSLNSEELELLKEYQGLENGAKMELIRYAKALLSEQVQKETDMEAQPPGLLDQFLDQFKDGYSIQELLNGMIGEFFDDGAVRWKPEMAEKVPFPSLDA